MAKYTKFKLTNDGLNLQTKVQAGATLSFTRFGLGSGTFVYPTDVPTMTDLVSEKMSLSVDEVRQLDTTHYQISTLVTSDDLPVTGFTLNEIGVFANDPDAGEILYGIVLATAPDSIPSAGEVFEYLVNINCKVSETSSVTMTVDPTAAATKQDIIVHSKEVDETDSDESKDKHLSNILAFTWKNHIDNHPTVIPSGTSMLFNQASAPTGWVKKSDWAANASLIVGNTYGSGGSDSPTSWTTAIAVAAHANHTHTGPNHTHTGPSHTHTGPSHTHTINHTHGTSSESLSNPGSNYSLTSASFSGSSGAGGTGSTGASGTANTGYSGTGATGAAGAASHTITQSSYVPRYQTVIAATYTP